MKFPKAGRTGRLVAGLSLYWGSKGSSFPKNSGREAN